MIDKEVLKQYKISGIYALTYEDEIIYIGQSTNICNRVKSHMKDTNVNDTIAKIYKEDGKVNRCKQLAMYHFIDKHKEDIGFKILKETDELNKYEKELIEQYKPRYNYKGVDVPY